MARAIMKYNPHYTEAQLNDMDFLRNAVKAGEEVRATDGLGLLQLKLFEANTEEKLIHHCTRPMCHRSHANDITSRHRPLRALHHRPRKSATASSELNDPKTRPRAGRRPRPGRRRQKAMFYDADYIKALGTACHRQQAKTSASTAWRAVHQVANDSRCDSVSAVAEG